MAVSAYWHGIHPGYYLSFMTIPLMLLAEDLMKAAFRTEQNRHIYDWANWFFRLRFTEYLSMGFLLLGGGATLRYWQSTYFIAHVFTFLFIGIGYAYRPKRGKRQDESDHMGENVASHGKHMGEHIASHGEHMGEHGEHMESGRVKLD